MNIFFSPLIIMPSRTLFVESEKDKKKIEVFISSNVTKDLQPETPAIIIAHPYGPLGNMCMFFFRNHFFLIALSFRRQPA